MAKENVTTHNRIYFITKRNIYSKTDGTEDHYANPDTERQIPNGLHIDLKRNNGQCDLRAVVTTGWEGRAGSGYYRLGGELTVRQIMRIG